MESEPDHSAAAVPQTLDREMAMIQAAITLVASGGAPRVVLSGLRFAEQLLDSAREIATGAGVRVVPVWTAAEHGTDLAVEQVP